MGRRCTIQKTVLQFIQKTEGVFCCNLLCYFKRHKLEQHPTIYAALHMLFPVSENAGAS